MSPFLRAVLAASLPLLLAACATVPHEDKAADGASRASVSYVNDAEYTDFSRVERERLTMEKELDAHFARLAQRLPAGQTLAVEVRDIDLAGRMEWTRLQNQDIRLLTGGADWPRMRLQYTLSENGQVLRSAVANLSDMTYLQHLNRYSSNETLRYEKQMLDDWFQSTFAPPPLSRRN